MDYGNWKAKRAKQVVFRDPETLEFEAAARAFIGSNT